MNNSSDEDPVVVSSGPKFEITPASVSWITVFAITAILSVAGNTVVILVFQARFPRKKCDTTLKPYLINLAVSDLIMAVFCMPFTFVDALSSWVFPETMCSLVLFFQVLAVSASVYTNVAIGLNRLRAILFPLRSFYTLRTYSWILVIIWLASLGMASVQLFVGQTVVYNTTIHCGEVWPTSHAARSYTLCIFALIYAIPLVILIGTYVTIGVSLWRNPRRDELLSKFKVVKMLVIVVAMFGICWLPLHLFTLLYDFYPQVLITLPNDTLTSLFISCHWLAMSNSFANPIIYGFTNESFRADLVTLFYMWFPCCVCLTKMMPRHSSGSTYETVVYRRQSLYKQGAKIGGTYQTRTVRSERSNKPYLNGHNSRNRYEYSDISKIDKNKNRSETLANGCGLRVVIATNEDKELLRLSPISRVSISYNSEATNNDAETDLRPNGNT